MSELRKVPVWAWVLALLAVVYQVTVRVNVATGAAAGERPVEAGGPPAPYALGPEFTHQCPVSWDGRWSWSPNKVGEWLYADGGC